LHAACHFKVPDFHIVRHFICFHHVFSFSSYRVQSTGFARPIHPHVRSFITHF
jgi:hypothetical protein